MKTIIIVRHGKAETLKGKSVDFDRRLTARGAHDVKKMAGRLIKRQIVPDMIVSSPAVRAIQTAERIAGAAHIQAEAIVARHELYDQDAAFLDIIHETDDAVRSILFSGHNPSVTEMVRILAPEFSGDLPTSGTAVVEFDTDAWADIAPGNGRLRLILAPGEKAVVGKKGATVRERRSSLSERLVAAVEHELAAYLGARDDSLGDMIGDVCRKIARNAIPKDS